MTWGEFENFEDKFNGQTIINKSLTQTQSIINIPKLRNYETWRPHLKIRKKD